MDKKVLSANVLFYSKEWTVTYNESGNYLETTNIDNETVSRMAIRDGQPSMVGLSDRYGSYLFDPVELEKHRVLASQYTNHLK